MASNSDTCNMHDINDNVIINKHSEYLQKNFKLKVSQDIQVLPSIYWVPKLHQNSTKSWFIIAFQISSLKPLTKSIIPVFKVIIQIVRNYSNKCGYFSGVNTFWTVLNIETLITRLESLSKRSKDESVMACDCSTLYIKIPHSTLLKVLNELTDFCFDGGLHKYVIVNRSAAKWVSNPDSYSLVFNKR